MAFISSLVETDKEEDSATWPKGKHSSSKTHEQPAAIQISSFKYFVARDEVFFPQRQAFLTLESSCSDVSINTVRSTGGHTSKCLFSIRCLPGEA